MIGFKHQLLDKLEDKIRSGEIKRILDMGSGLSLNFLPLLAKFPELEYVGVEPSAPHHLQAQKNIAPFKHARVIRGNGYEPSHEWWGSFDLVISLSVLEHVKHLDQFIENSTGAARSGGIIIHSWDLGHALYPISVKERLQVWLGNNAPYILPEDKFVKMVRPGEVESILQKCGVEILDTSYHQMPCHKKLIKELASVKSSEVQSALKSLIDFEFNISKHLESIPEDKKLKLFPTVVISAKKI